MPALLLVKAPTTAAPDPGAPMAPGLWCSRCVRAGSRLGWRTLGLKEIALGGQRLAATRTQVMMKNIERAITGAEPKVKVLVSPAWRRPPHL
jgi:hypothetical protein